MVPSCSLSRTGAEACDCQRLAGDGKGVCAVDYIQLHRGVGASGPLVAKHTAHASQVSVDLRFENLPDEAEVCQQVGELELGCLDGLYMSGERV